MKNNLRIYTCFLLYLKLCHNSPTANEEQFLQNTRSSSNGEKFSQNQRQVNQRSSQSRYYEFLDDDTRPRKKPTSLSDVWLCLACALGWTIWLVSTQQPVQQLIFEERDSSKAMGHVLQVNLGNDTLGTGIPVYYALVDYVVEGERDIYM